MEVDESPSEVVQQIQTLQRESIHEEIQRALAEMIQNGAQMEDIFTDNEGLRQEAVRLSGWSTLLLLQIKIARVLADHGEIAASLSVEVEGLVAANDLKL